MELEIQGMANSLPRDILKQDKAKGTQGRVEQNQEPRAEKKPVSKAYIEQYLQKVFHNYAAFNKRLKFSVNEELDQVVVKVIDSSTDKVIREIPPEELQRLQVKIREAVGLLFDQMI